MEEPNFRASLQRGAFRSKHWSLFEMIPTKSTQENWEHSLEKCCFRWQMGVYFRPKKRKNGSPEKLQKKSKIIYNAVKEDFYQIERTPVRGEIVTCGRLVEQKNHALLIDAFSEVCKKISLCYTENLWRRSAERKTSTPNQ